MWAAIRLEKGFFVQLAHFKNSEWMLKKYPVSNDILIPLNKARLNRLKENERWIYPNTHIQIDEKFIKVFQLRMYEYLDFYRKKSMAHAIEISKCIDKLHRVGLIHGDLCSSNCKLDRSGRVLLFDWEPFLITQRGPNTILRSSKYALHPDDYSQKTISKSSDKFAVSNLIVQMIFGRYIGLKQCKKNKNFHVDISFSSKCCVEMLQKIVNHYHL